MIFFFWTGQKIDRKTIGSGNFHCPACNREQRYTRYQLKRRTMLYSIIPLGRGEDMGGIVECERCHTDFPTQVLLQDVPTRSSSVWICAQCGNVNSEADDRCLRCGTAAGSSSSRS